MNCMYCYEPFKKIVLTGMIGTVVALEIEKKSLIAPMGLMVHVQDGALTNHHYVGIRYCPMCGRKLEAEDETRN